MLAGVFMGCEVSTRKGGSVSVGYRVSTSKGGWCLCALWGFSRQGRKVDGCRSKVHSYGKLDESRLIEKMAKCEICESYVNIDRT